MNDMVDSKLYEEVASCTNVISGDEYQRLFCTVAQVVSDMVAQTLGPYGATTIIDDGAGFTYPTKDGWSCMNRLRFSDPIYNSIFNILKQVSFNSVSTVGDGTTTAMVATSYFLNEFYETLLPMLKHGDRSFSQAEFIKTMNYAVELICDRLRKNPNIKKIDPNGDFEDIYKIAYIATNGNEEFANMIRQIYQETKNPNIRVELDGGSPETKVVIEKGYRFDCKVISYRNYVNGTDGTIRWGVDNPFSIIILDHNVTFNMHRTFIPVISQLASKMGRKIMILAPYFDDLICGEIDSQVTEMIRQRQEPNIMLVQIPMTARIHQEAINDIAVLTNALLCTQSRVKLFNLMIQNSQIPNEEDKIHDPIEQYSEFKKYTSPEPVLRDCLGTVESITFDQSRGFISDYQKHYSQERYDKLMWEVEKEYVERKAKADKTLDGTLDKDYLAAQSHYIRLTGNCGLIKVGGLSDIQRRCDKDALDDATLACKSAYQYGYVRGMGFEILSICEAMQYEPLDELVSEIIETISVAFNNTNARLLANKYGSDIEALQMDSTSIEIDVVSDDADVETPIKTTIRELGSTIRSYCTIDDCGYGYDLRKNQFQSSGNWTVINSVQTDIEILTAMTNIVSTIMTSSQFLSMSKAYDNKSTHDKALKSRMADEAAIAQAKTNAVIKEAQELGITPTLSVSLN